MRMTVWVSNGHAKGKCVKVCSHSQWQRQSSDWSLVCTEPLGEKWEIERRDQRTRFRKCARKNSNCTALHCTLYGTVDSTLDSCQSLLASRTAVRRGEVSQLKSDRRQVDLYRVRPQNGPQEIKRTKQQPGTAGPGNMLRCCLVSFHFLWAILWPHPVRNVICELMSTKWKTDFERGMNAPVRNGIYFFYSWIGSWNLHFYASASRPETV